MKKKDSYRLCSRLILFMILVVVAGKTWAADSPSIPLVHILATDPWAAEEGQDPGSFTVIRTGPIGDPLTVHYRVGGTAENGVDYETLTGEVTIPADFSWAPINLFPFDDVLIERNESVVVGLVQPLDVDPPPYIICWPSVAALTLEDNDTLENLPPRVGLINPPDGSVFMGPVSLRLTARATDLDGRVRTVEFFANGHSLGIVTNRPLILDPIPLEDINLDLNRDDVPQIYPSLDAAWSDLSIAPDLEYIPGNLFNLAWEAVPAGRHVLTAVATDNRGAHTTSAPITIEVTPPPSQPIVEVFAVDPSAAEPDTDADPLDTALFHVRRSGGDPMIPLPVFYRVGGSASNGEDYSEIPNMVVIEPGHRAAEILIKPIDDKLAEGSESVFIHILPPACIEIYPPPPDCYVVGRNAAARAVIHDNDVDPDNRPPAVRIVQPADGDVFMAPADLRLVAAASDSDGTVRSVEFFEGENSLGIVINDPNRLAPDLPPFVLSWTGVSPGKYVLTALATDHQGAQSLSRPVEILVIDRQLPTVVTVRASDGEASEGPQLIGSDGTTRIDTATFQVHRSGATTEDLMVFYRMSGQAENGVDYRQLTSEVLIPAGAATAEVVIVPIDDTLCEGTESVRIEILPPLCLPIFPPPPSCYTVGDQGTSFARIADNEICPPNQPPKVAIVQPEDGMVFRGPLDLVLVAEAGDGDGVVRQVEFFAGEKSLGVASNTSLDQNHFRLPWPNVGPGAYALTAVATDNDGLTTRSEPVHIRVIEMFELPVVTIEATDPSATEGPIVIGPGDIEPAGAVEGNLTSDGPILLDTASFMVRRSGRTNEALAVFYQISGTADNGKDYVQLSGEVLIPAGRHAMRVEVFPIDDEEVEGPESVVLTLIPVPCLPDDASSSGCYLVGSPERAVANIRDDDERNQRPNVEIVRPGSGQIFPLGEPIGIQVAARDPDGWVGLVEFFDGDHKIGEDSIVFIQPPPPGEAQRFSMIWSNAAPDGHGLTVRATDNLGATSFSDPVEIKVLEDCRLPVVNLTVVDPYASEQDPRLDIPSDPALFRVCRSSCATEEDLLVVLEIGGTAENGADYEFIRDHVLIPAGESCAEIFVNAIDDDFVEGIESVNIRLPRPDCLVVDPMPAGCYLVGPNAGGTAYIRDNDLPDNRPPKVAVINPPDGTVFPSPTDIRVVAAAEDSDGHVHTVEFFADGVSIGVVTNHPWILDPIRVDQDGQVIEDPNLVWETSVDPTPIPFHPFAILWANVPPGPHVLRAVATDNDGASATSEPVQIKVLESSLDPIVEVIARDPIAAEGCRDTNADCVDTARFVVRRSGSTEHPLRVFYRLGGAAENGVDYRELPNSVVINVGESHAAITVAPIDDLLVEGAERVILTLVEVPCLEMDSTDIAVGPDVVSRGCYEVGRAHTAQAVIYDNDTAPNAPPVVRMVSPADGDIFRAPALIKLAASAFDLDGQVVQVEFFEGENSLGVVPTPEILPYAQDASLDPNTSIMRPLYVLEWADVPPGHYVLTAVATDDQDETSISEPVEIKVVSSNLPPVVTIETIDPTATEQSPLIDSIPDTAAFLVTREGGDLSRPLEVFYRLGGSAENGVDYEKLSGSIVLEADQASAKIEILAIDDLICEGRESLWIGLVSHPCIAIFPPPPECYTVGTPDTARAVILDDDICPPNQPPRIAIVRPGDGDVFRAPADLLICAAAKDSDGRVVRVDFYANEESIGSVHLNTSDDPELFCIKWGDVPAGGYVLTAVAADNEGLFTRSEPVRIRVIESPTLPVVTIVASDAVASEGGAVGSFTVARDCCTAYPLHVRYSVEGTAANGEDYQWLSGFVTIPEGAKTARIVVDPIDDERVEGTETVVARLEPALCAAASPLPVDCYTIGHPSRDVVFIRDNDSSENEPPLIAILRPSEGAGFGAPADIPILAVGLDPDGWISLVEFFANETKIGELSIQFLVPPSPGELQTFDLDWNEVPEGVYTLTARATDNRGASTVSGPIHLRVLDPCRVPVVSVHSPDPIAAEGRSEDGNTATFVISRGCGFAERLAVRYALNGTAENGVDYALLTGVAEFAAGSESVRVVVDPIEDDLPEGVETVILELIQPPCLGDGDGTGSTGCYLVGQPNRALAYIRDNDNQSPKVELIRPFHGQIFQAPAAIEFVVGTIDPDGWVGRVQFLANGEILADQIIDFIVPPPPGQKQEFRFIWEAVGVGDYVLTARVFDNDGAESESDPVPVKVGESEPPPVVTIHAIDGYAREGTTNTAVFAVRRLGDNTGPLIVHYAVRGTAENGVDYKRIPSSVEIPAGRNSMRIVMEAAKDEIQEDLETVALQLRLPDPANSTVSPSYVIGRPSVAAAVIVDADRERPGCRHLADGYFHVCLPGRDGEGYRIMATTDFGDWEEIFRSIVIDGAIHFVDPDADLHGKRFYLAEPAAVTLEEN